MPKRMYLFVAVFTVAILFICFFTTFVFTQSLGIGDGKATALYSLAFFVTLAFIVAFATSRSSAVRGRNAFYIFAMTLGGYGLYLFIMSIPLALLIVIFSVVGLAMPLWIPMFAFAIALVVGIIGHIQSWVITTKQYDVTIPNLPDWWLGKRAVLVTDTHFGLVRKEKFARQIVKKVGVINPDIIFHGGDFYDGPDINTSELTTIWKALAEKTPIFYTPGNHELFGNYAAFIASIRDAGVTVLEDKMTMHEGMQIAGITYRNKKQFDDAAHAIRGLDIDTSIPAILINHPPTFHDAAADANISLMLSGHTHNGQFWPGTYFARMVYGKYAYGKFKIDNKMTAITSRGVGTAGPPMRLWNSPELVVITFKNKV